LQETTTNYVKDNASVIQNQICKLKSNHELSLAKGANC